MELLWKQLTHSNTQAVWSSTPANEIGSRAGFSSLQTCYEVAEKSPTARITEFTRRLGDKALESLKREAAQGLCRILRHRHADGVSCIELRRRYQWALQFGF